MMWSWICWISVWLFVCHGVVDCAVGNGNNDLSLHSYSSEGDILQIRYANYAVIKSNPILCFRSAKCRAKVLLVAHRAQSELSLPCKHNQCMHFLAKQNLLVVITGYPADRIAAVQYLHRWIESYFHKYAEYPSIDSIASELGMWSVRGMYSSMQDEDKSLRPMAISAYFTTPFKSSFNQHLKGFMKVDNAGSINVEQEGFIGDMTSSLWSSITAGLHALEQEATDSSSELDRKKLLLAMANEVVESLPEEYDDLECAIVWEDEASDSQTSLSTSRRDVVYCPPAAKDVVLTQLKHQLLL